MPEQLDIFVRDPITIAIDLPDGGRRELRVHRVVARHVAAWDAFWASLGLEFVELEPDQAIERELTLVKAGIPEPRPTCPAHCICQGNEGIHELIDRLDREQLDAVFAAVLRVNAPKDVPDRKAVPAAAGSGLMRRLPGLSLLASRRRTPSTSR